MRFKTSFINRSIFIMAILTVIFIGFIHAQVKIIAPVEDVFFYTFGGGEGCNTYIKYDITSVPGGSVIDSVFLTAYVYQINGGWDGDVNFWNVNDQDWTEADSCRLLWNLPTSDSTYQASNFGSVTGWTQSVDLTNIFLTDYNAGNTYCSIKIKDPDDVTFMPVPGSYPYDYDDSLMLGNRAISAVGYIVFYPHEWSNAPPWLNVYYHEVGIDEGNHECARPILQVWPNPCQDLLNINLNKGHGIEGSTLRIYSMSGQVVREFDLAARASKIVPITWNCTNNVGCLVPNGIYFCKIETREHIVIEKICVIR